MGVAPRKFCGFSYIPVSWVCSGAACPHRMRPIIFAPVRGMMIYQALPPLLRDPRGILSTAVADRNFRTYWGNTFPLFFALAHSHHCLILISARCLEIRASPQCRGFASLAQNRARGSTVCFAPQTACRAGPRFDGKCPWGSATRCFWPLGDFPGPNPRQVAIRPAL